MGSLRGSAWVLLLLAPRPSLRWLRLHVQAWAPLPAPR
jgi:hypothetical protein